MEYLVGTLMAGFIWLACFLWRKDLRHQMLWAGTLYTVIMTVGFFASKLLRDVPEYQTINPGYWSPETLFNLNAITGGFSIEDVLFMIFFGGIAGVMYELVAKTSPPNVPVKQGIKLAIPLAIVAAALISRTGVNLMYSIIIFGFAGAFVIWLQRVDLVWRSLVGGFSFLIVYVSVGLLLLSLFPHFIEFNYHLENVSGILLVGIPLEEYLFAFGFGSMWSVIYPYTSSVGYRIDVRI